MSKKFIPNSDSKFAEKARAFAKVVAKDHARFAIPLEESEKLTAAVTAFRDAVAKNYNRFARSMATTARKDEARRIVEQLIRRVRHLLEVSPNITASDRVLLGIPERPTRLKKQQCPQTPPTMHLVVGVHGSYGSNGKHVIKFYDSGEKLTRSKPQGAARLELFAEIVPLNEKTPMAPAKTPAGWVGYVRSYTRSPIKVDYPKYDAPVRMVYWARWANNTGETGPFSKPLIAPMEAVSTLAGALPAPASAPRLEQKVIITSAVRELPDYVETIDRMAAELRKLLPDAREEAA